MYTYFSGTVDVDGHPYEIAATTNDDTRTLIQKALEIEFYGEIPVFYEKAEDLPENYIVFNIVYGYYSAHGDNLPLMERTNFDVVFITNDLSLKNTIPKRIAKSLIDKGFLCVQSGRDLIRDYEDEQTDYYGVTQEFSWQGVF